MRVTFKIEGGAAHFPGLARLVEIDTAKMPRPEAEELEGRVRAARLFERPERPGTATVPDARRYVLAVEDAGRRRDLVLHEPVEDPALGALLADLRRRQRRLLAAR